MSNCVEFHKGTGTLVLPDWAFNVKAFRAEFEKHSACGDPFKQSGHDDNWYQEHGTYDWFLTPRNVEFGNNDRYVVVKLGEGYSSHTWRDFKHTLIELSKFITQKRNVSFVMSDEYDGHKELFRHYVYLPTTAEQEFGVKAGA